MSLRKRIEQIARDTATDAVRGLLAQQQGNTTTAAFSNIGQIDSIKGGNITVNMPDGSQQTVVSATGRPLGADSVGLIINGVIY